MANDHTIGTAVEEIDQVLGGRYVKEHPEMVAAWLQANAIAKAAARIGDAINGLNEVLRSNHPPQGRHWSKPWTRSLTRSRGAPADDASGGRFGIRVKNGHKADGWMARTRLVISPTIPRLAWPPIFP